MVIIQLTRWVLVKLFAFKSCSKQLYFSVPKFLQTFNYMANLKLSSLDIRQLLNSYEAKLRQLQFEADQTKKMIRDLKAAIPAIEQVESAQLAVFDQEISALADVTALAEEQKPAKPAKTTKRVGRPATKGKKPRTPKAKAAAPEATTTEATTTEATAPAEPKVKKTRKTKKAADKSGRAAGYRLSEYDQYIFDALQATGKAMINSEFLTYIEESKAAQGLPVDAEEISTMVTRSLQKLANRRTDIAKVPYEGRGMAYALPEWLNPQKELKAKYKR